MTNKVFLITSTINPKFEPFNYKKCRSYFNSQQRLQQTVYTVNNIHALFPEGKIIIIDSSENYSEYYSVFRHFNFVEYFSLYSRDNQLCDIVNSHKHKSFCETLMLNYFYKTNIEYIKNFDFVFKINGRYFYSNIDKNIFSIENKNKCFFKGPMTFPWRKPNSNNQYSSAIYSFGSNLLDKFIAINDDIEKTLVDPKYSFLDLELMFFRYTKILNLQVVETNWKVLGWDGTNGNFVCY